MHRTTWLLASCAAAAAALAGCGNAGGTAGSDGGGGTDSVISGSTLRLEPDTVALVADIAGGSTSETIRVLQRDARDGPEVDVTATATLWLLDPGLATVQGATISEASHGGTTSIRASVPSGLTATGTLHVKLAGDIVVAGFDPTAKDGFNSPAVDTDPARQPAIEYPLHETIVPNNLPPMELQWSRGGDGRAYRIHLTSADTLEVWVYSPTREALPETGPWRAILASAVGARVELLVEALGTNGICRSAPVSFSVARDAIDETVIYYWESSTDKLKALEFATGTLRDLPVSDSAYAPGKPGVCIACHTVSRDGKRVYYTTITNGAWDPGTLVLGPDQSMFFKAIEPGQQQVPAGFTWTYAAFNPAEQESRPALLVTKADRVAQNAPGHVRLALLDPDTGRELDSNLDDWLAAFSDGLGRDLLEPDWSPSGFVVFASYDSETPNPDPGGALAKAYVRDLGDDAVATSIVEATITYDAGLQRFALGPPEVLVPASLGTSLDTTETNVLPQFSPDDAFVAFTRADGWWPIRLQTDPVNGTGRIALCRRADKVVIELARASGPPGSNSTWPQWAPTVGTDYAWVAFSSERPYGHRMAPGVSLPSSCIPQGRSLCKNMWVAAIDLNAAREGSSDPSLPPFWLPGQDPLASAVSPRWTHAALILQ